ncbi:atlastin-2 [Galendromus occidentalis]|uniref:Atlastin-2 n=1 Tax=Galendromus occidentalis TaxID=34638 RepID=A0AAJ7L6Y4_9ACAR|nr:atlastin-2 [Galendromus occidentalis]
MTVKEDLSSISPEERAIQSERGPVAGPIQLLAVEKDHTFTLNEEELSKLLLREDVRDLKVVVVAVAGAFRKGKSFLLDFFLRYMRANGSKDWMGDDDTPLQGFTWRGGCERDTTGILVWNEVFKVKTPKGEELAVIFMDTQGTFDSDSTVKDCCTIFALSTMTSSTLIYNLSQNIQEDDLQHLQLFTEYGRLAYEEGNLEGTPFQKLLFLVRDWYYIKDAAYGSEGGQKILDRRLQISEKHTELQVLRKHIRKCFSSLECFLLPHPGLRVATSEEFDGRNKDIENDFKTQLGELVPSLLAPENLVKKQVNGRDVTCKELLQYIRAYVEIFGGNELPEPKNMVIATAEANNLNAISECKDVYKKQMEKICGGEQSYITPRELFQHHEALKDAAKRRFEGTRKMGNEEFCQIYLEKLLEDLDDTFVSYQKYNEGKNFFAQARTPACIFGLVLGALAAMSTFSMFGIYSLANFCQIIIWILFATFAAWAYVRFTGERREVGKAIDEAAQLTFTFIFKPIGKKVFQGSNIPYLADEQISEPTASRILAKKKE